MGAHKRKSKNGLPRMTRTERQYRTRALHEAAHAVVGEASGVKVDFIQIFTESDVNEKRFMKMSGAGGLAKYSDETEDLRHEQKLDLTSYLAAVVAPRLAEEMAEFTDKSLIEFHATADMEHIQTIIADNPSNLDLGEGQEIKGKGTLIKKIVGRSFAMLFLKAEEGPVVRFIVRLNTISTPHAEALFEYEAFDLLCRPSITQAIREVADSLMERRQLPGADVRAILSGCLDKFAENDLEMGYEPCKLREDGGMALTERGVEYLRDFYQKMNLPKSPSVAEPPNATDQKDERL